MLPSRELRLGGWSVRMGWDIMYPSACSLLEVVVVVAGTVEVLPSCSCGDGDGDGGGGGGGAVTRMRHPSGKSLMRSAKTARSSGRSGWTALAISRSAGRSNGVRVRHRAAAAAVRVGVGVLEDMAEVLWRCAEGVVVKVLVVAHLVRKDIARFDKNLCHHAMAKPLRHLQQYALRSYTLSHSRGTRAAHVQCLHRGLELMPKVYTAYRIRHTLQSARPQRATVTKSNKTLRYSSQHEVKS